MLTSVNTTLNSSAALAGANLLPSVGRFSKSGVPAYQNRQELTVLEAITVGVMCAGITATVASMFACWLK